VPGPEGPPGGLAGYEKRISPITSVSTNSSGTTVTITCTAGKRVLGGGYFGNASDVTVFRSAPTDNNDGWQITARASNSGRSLTAYALCANPAQ
jgi:hypothetical protein